MHLYLSPCPRMLPPKPSFINASNMGQSAVPSSQFLDRLKSASRSRIRFSIFALISPKWFSAMVFTSPHDRSLCTTRDKNVCMFEIGKRLTWNDELFFSLQISLRHVSRIRLSSSSGGPSNRRVMNRRTFCLESADSGRPTREQLLTRNHFIPDFKRQFL